MQQDRRPTFAFLNLPAELRNYIYELILDQVVDQERHPSQAVAWKPRAKGLFQDIHSLLVTCRQIRDETKSIFIKDYLPRTVFCFESALKLFYFSKDCTASPLELKHARFSLRCSSATPGMDDTEQHLMVRLILRLAGSSMFQPIADSGSWVECMNSYLTHPGRNPFPRAELRGLEEKGFVLTWVAEGNHFLPSYSRVVFPKDIWLSGTQSLVLTGCTFQDYKQSRVSSFWSQDAWAGCLILDGKICDVECGRLSTE